MTGGFLLLSSRLTTIQAKKSWQRVFRLCHPGTLLVFAICGASQGQSSAGMARKLILQCESLDALGTASKTK
jgi:hypothetical protein